MWFVLEDIILRLNSYTYQTQFSPISYHTVSWTPQKFHAQMLYFIALKTWVKSGKIYTNQISTFEKKITENNEEEARRREEKTHLWWEKTTRERRGSIAASDEETPNFLLIYCGWYFEITTLPILGTCVVFEKKIQNSCHEPFFLEVSRNNVWCIFFLIKICLEKYS